MLTVCLDAVTGTIFVCDETVGVVHAAPTPELINVLSKLSITSLSLPQPTDNGASPNFQAHADVHLPHTEVALKDHVATVDGVECTLVFDAAFAVFVSVGALDLDCLARFSQTPFATVVYRRAGCELSVINVDVRSFALRVPPALVELLMGYVASLTFWDFTADVVRVHIPSVEKLTFGVGAKAVEMVTVDAPVVVLDGAVPLSVEIGGFYVFRGVAGTVLRHKMFFDQVVARTAVRPLLEVDSVEVAVEEAKTRAVHVRTSNVKLTVNVLSLGTIANDISQFVTRIDFAQVDALHRHVEAFLRNCTTTRRSAASRSTSMSRRSSSSSRRMRRSSSAS